MGDPDSKIFFGVVLLIVLAVLGFIFRDAIFPPADEVTVDEPVSEEVVKPEGPRHPIDAPADDEAEDTRPLPPLDESDNDFLARASAVFGRELEALLLRENVIDRLVATVDSLPRASVSEKIRPVQTLPTAFDAEGDESAMQISKDNARRYDAVVAQIVNADPDAMAAMYRRYYPLFQESYERLGYPDGYFNDRLIEVIDHLLETPRPKGPLMLKRPSVLYEFADPELEKLSAGQKLMLRLGNEHGEKLRGVLRELRARIVEDEAVEDKARD